MNRLTRILQSAACIALVATSINSFAAEGIETLANGDTKITINPGDSAGLLVQKAEKMMTPNGIMHAYDLINKALQADSSHNAARIYSAALYPMTINKGILKRIRPIMRRISRKALSNYDNEVSKIPDSSMKSYLLDGVEDINTAQKVQTYLNQVKEAQDQFYKFTKNNKDSNFEVNLNIVKNRTNFRSLVSVCEIEKRSSTEYLIKRCPFTETKKAIIGPADMEVIRHMAAGQKISSILTTAYNLKGGVQLAALIERVKPNDREIIANAKSRNELGKLKSDNELNELVQMGTDLVDGFEWIKGLERQLCPNRSYTLDQRRGKLFSNGLCANDNSEPTTRIVRSVVSTVEKMLAGPALIDYYSKGNGSSQQTLVAGREFLENPAADLKSILPDAGDDANFDKCGQATQLADTTIGGLLPNQDGNKVLTDLGALNKSCNP